MVVSTLLQRTNTMVIALFHVMAAPFTSRAARWQGLRPGHMPLRHLPARRRTLVERRIACEAPNWNPQNTPNPQRMPSPEFDAVECVRVQLEALQNNDQPWPNHGVQTAYEFGDDIGGLDPSWYFGFRKDLYHMDHFMGQFSNTLGELINCSTIESIEELPTPAAGPGGDEWRPDAVVRAVVRNRTGAKALVVEFSLKRRTFGSKKGALMTRMLRKVAPE